MERIDIIESKIFKLETNDFKEKLALFNKKFDTKVEPINGMYGVTEKVNYNGDIVRTGKNEAGHTYKEYYNNDKLYMRRETIGEGKNVTTYYDDNGVGYLKATTLLADNKAKEISYSLKENTTAVRGNYSVEIDAYGRPVRNSIKDLTHNSNPRGNLPDVRDASYKLNDHRGHLISHRVGGPSTADNIVPQLDKINQGKMARVENTLEKLKAEGHTVDYEVKTNYVGTDKRPSSFEPKITVDGKEYTELPDDLKKIYNDTDMTAMKKIKTDIGEKYGIAHEEGVKSGLIAAGITFTVSTVDNVTAYIDGEISVEEMVVDIVSETAAAGAIEYGSELISAGVSHAMSKSSKALIQKVAGSSLPVAAVSFAVESYDTVTAYARGEIDGAELAYELGDNAASIEGAMKGAAVGATVGSFAGPIGVAAGGFVGGVIGTVVASEIYATAVEIGAEGAEAIAEQAEKFAKDTIDIVKENLPEKLESVKSAFSDFISANKLPFKI